MNAILSDVRSGFSVFLIALPLSLGIAMASGVPPLSGLIAAMVGGLVVSRFSGGFVSINGPAAGLIVVVATMVEILGQGNALVGYRGALAATVLSGALLTLFGLFRWGRLADYVPQTAIHGMLASIGIMIMGKQAHVALGVMPPSGSPLSVIAQIPYSIMKADPEIVMIAGVSLGLLILLPRVKALAKFPSAMAVVVVGILLGQFFDLDHPHVYLFPAGHPHLIGPSFLVTLPKGLLSGVTFPDFHAVFNGWHFWKLATTLCLIQGLETLLSASAVDQFDPKSRKTDLNRDLLAVGLGTVVSGFLGGLPLITEIVRSKANVLNGGRTQWANFFHGFFLLTFVLLCPFLLQEIPLASLAAILMMTGFTLASPSQFKHVWEVGSDQFVVFTGTILVTLATDLLVGVLFGTLLELVIVGVRSSGWRALLSSPVSKVGGGGKSLTVSIQGVVWFANYPSLHRSLNSFAEDVVELDFRACKGIDHTSMERLAFLAREWSSSRRELRLVNTEHLASMTEHDHAPRWMRGYR